VSTPPGEWLTIGEAAARLGCSSRTISRRIAGGEMRINDGPDGRRVLLTVPDRVAATVSALREEGDRQIQLAGAAVSAACHAQEQAEKTADLARGDLRRSQQWGTGLALSLFVILSAGGVGVGLGAWRISGQRADLVNIADDLANVTDDLAVVVGERDRFAEIAETTADDLERAQRDLAASAGAWMLFADQLDAAAARAQGEQWGTQSVLASPGP